VHISTVSSQVVAKQGHAIGPPAIRAARASASGLKKRSAQDGGRAERAAQLTGSGEVGSGCLQPPSSDPFHSVRSLPDNSSGEEILNRTCDFQSCPR